MMSRSATRDYRRDGPNRRRTMTLSPDEFIRRFRCVLHSSHSGYDQLRSNSAVRLSAHVGHPEQ
jgi:hypothetical protein